MIRFRIDGALRRILAPQRKLAALLVSRIKVMSKLDIAEARAAGWAHGAEGRRAGD